MQIVGGTVQDAARLSEGEHPGDATLVSTVRYRAPSRAISELARRQMRAVREELDHKYEAQNGLAAKTLAPAPALKSPAPFGLDPDGARVALLHIRGSGPPSRDCPAIAPACKI